MTRPTQPGTRVLDFRAEKPVKPDHDLENVTAHQYPLLTMSATNEPSEVESQEILPQDMKKPTRKRKAPTRFQQSPAKPIHKSAWRNSAVKNRKQPGPTLHRMRKKSQKEPSVMDSQVDSLLSEDSNGELQSASQAKKRPGRQPGQSLSYGKRLTEEEEIILMKCCLANCIKEDFYEEAGRAYTGVQRKMEQLVKDRKKELSKEVSRALSGVAVRDDEWARTLDDWLEIYEHHEGGLLRKKQKLHTAQKNKKDDRQYRDNMAYRIGLKKKDELGGHELSKTSSDSRSSDAEAIQETQPESRQITKNQPHKLRSHNTRLASECLPFRLEKSSLPIPSHDRPPKRMRKRTASPIRKKISRPNADFPDDLHA
ncbi:hypothetical protein MMC31_004515 [Peltigera leucophlebia]|nr:hypothetical protein [Peltigera leucophlebia]